MDGKKIAVVEHKYKISIITVVYNAVKTMDYTIKSVLDQSYKNIEYIIIDGQSSDGTQQIIMQYLDSIAYFISEKDAGIYDAMNKGIKYATGDYIIFLNSDDRLMEDSMEQCVRYLDDEVDILYGDIYLVQKDGIENRIKGKLEYTEDIIYRGICHQAVLAKTELLKCHQFDISYKIAADYDWLLRMFYLGANFVYVPIVFSYYNAFGYSAVNRDLCLRECYKISVKYLRKSCGRVQEKYASIIKEFYYMYLIEDMCEDAEGIKAIGRILGEIFESGEDIYMFGRGKNAGICLKVLSIFGINVLKVFDNNEALYNTTYQGIEVVGLNRYADKEIKVLVTTTSYEKEVYQQVIENGFKYVVLFSDIKEKICQEANIC